MTDKVKITVPGDRSKATIEFLPLSGASGTLELTADQLLKLIQWLGQAHATMIVGVELPPLEGQQIQGIINAQWYVNPELMGEATAMSFFHPAFGPLGFLIPIDQMEHMIHLLTTQVEMAKALKAGRAN
jgi:hypothetical protein